MAGELRRVSDRCHVALACPCSDDWGALAAAEKALAQAADHIEALQALVTAEVVWHPASEGTPVGTCWLAGIWPSGLRQVIKGVWYLGGEGGGFTLVAWAECTPDPQFPVNLLPKDEIHA